MGPAESVRLTRFDSKQEAGAVERLPDRVLMDQVRSGDREAYRTLLEHYWPPLVLYAAGIVGSEDSAKDVVQDVFIRIWRYRVEWSPTGTVSAYLYRITRNLALNARRDRKAELGRRARSGNSLRPSFSGSNPDENLAARTLREEVEAAIAALPERRRETFVLSRFHGLSYKEIGEAMGISPQTVANQMRAALAELRCALSSHLDDDD